MRFLATMLSHVHATDKVFLLAGEQAAFSLHIKYVVHISYYSFLPSILLFGHFLLEPSVGSWLIGVDSAGYGLLCVLVISMLMNIVPTTTTLSCASATTGPC